MLKQKTEEQFGTAFIDSNALSQLVSSQGYFIRELETLHGRPDLVLFETQNPSHELIRNALASSLSTGAFATVFLALKSSRRSLSELEIAIDTGLSYGYVLQVFRAMKQQGLIVQLKNDKYKLHPNASIPHINIISIEFKLHDWKKALKQSIRHRAFADKAFVIMPLEKKALLRQKLSLFTDFGVSVAVFDQESGYFETLHEVSEDKLSELSYIDVLGRFWASPEQVVQVT